MSYFSRVFLLAVFGAAGAAQAQVSVDAPWVRGTVEGQNATGAYMELKSEKDLTLLGVTSPIAKTVELHNMEMKDGLMKMQAVEKLALPAGKVVKLAPGGYHVMLIDLKQTLRNGDSVPLQLTLEDAAHKKQTLEVKAEVRGLGMPMKADAAHTHSH
jgi:copper(I)-binding protein